MKYKHLFFDLDHTLWDFDANAKEIRELRFENSKLKEKREDIQWVAKSEFDELKKAFASKEQELTRLKEAHG